MIPTRSVSDSVSDPSTDSVDRLTEPSRTNVRTDSRIVGVSVERDSLLLSNARETEQIYLVRWPNDGFVKVGYSCNGKRWRTFIRRGGRLLGLATFPRGDELSAASSAEYLLHIGLATRLPRAFGHRSEAVDFLGHNGAGWTECYVDDGSLALPMFSLAAEVIRSGDWDAYWMVRQRWERPLSEIGDLR